MSVNREVGDFTIAGLPYGDEQIPLTEPITLQPALTPDGELILLEYEPFTIMLAAHSRKELDQMLAADLEMLWRDYAMQEDELLSAGAVRLKRNLRQATGLAPEGDTPE